MDAEKVDVATVPITDIQLHKDKSKTILAVSLYGVGKLYLYKINSETLAYSNLECIDVDAPIFSYFLSSRLYILSSKLNIYEFIDNKTRTVSFKTLEDELLEYKNLFACNSSDITLMYKRRYDNVQEYMERKKLRLEAK